MKKYLKFFSVVLACALLASTAVLLTGCKEPITSREGARAVVVAADNYKKTHAGYDNFENSTMTFSSVESSSGTEVLTYKPSAESEEEITRSFTNTVNNSDVYTINIFNKSRTGALTIDNDIHVYVKHVSTQKSKTYYVDEDGLLQEDIVDEKVTNVYTLASVIEGEGVDAEVVYYVTLSTKVERAGENAEVEQTYFKFADSFDYSFRIGEYLDRLNEIIDESYFFCSQTGNDLVLYMSLAQFSRDGDKVEISFERTLPQISGASTVLTTIINEVSFNGKNIDKSSTKMYVENPSLGKATMTADIAFARGSSAVELPSLEHYTEVEDEIIIPVLENE